MNIQILLTRLNQQMTDAQIGQEIGAPQATVTRLRNGVHKSTSWHRAEAIRILANAKGIESTGTEQRSADAVTDTGGSGH